MKDNHLHILIDEMVELTGTDSKKKYSGKLRRVVVWGQKNEQTIEIITNQTSWTANTISELYKSRWQIEMFFREIKQEHRGRFMNKLKIHSQNQWNQEGDLKCKTFRTLLETNY
ncbi:MAG: hypothetical protein ACJA0Q_002162 [Saprospiraceae bacterium]